MLLKGKSKTPTWDALHPHAHVSNLESKDKLDITALDNTEGDRPKLLPYALSYPPDAGDVATIIAGPLSQEDSLLIPSTQIIWKDENSSNEEFLKEMKDRFGEEELFGHVLTTGPYRVEHISKKLYEELKGKSGFYILSISIFRGDLDNPEHVKALKERATRTPVYVDAIGCEQARFRRWKKFSIESTDFRDMIKLSYDPAKKADRSASTPQRDDTCFISNSLILKNQIRRIAEQMRHTVQNALDVEEGLRVSVAVFDYRKPEAARSVVDLHKMGKRLFGKNYWRRGSLVLGVHWKNTGFVPMDHEAKCVVQAWKNKKTAKPKGKLASEVWDAIQDVSHAKGQPGKKKKRRA